MNELQRLILSLLKSSGDTKFNVSFIKKAFFSQYKISDFLGLLSKNTGTGKTGSEIAKSIVLEKTGLQADKIKFLKENFSVSQISKIDTDRKFTLALNREFAKDRQKIIEKTNKYKNLVKEKSGGNLTFSFNLSNMTDEEFRKLSIKEKMDVIKQYKKELSKLKNKDEFLKYHSQHIMRRVVYIMGVGLVGISDEDAHHGKKLLNKYFGGNNNFNIEYDELDKRGYYSKNFKPKLNYTKRQMRQIMKNKPMYKAQVIAGVVVNTRPKNYNRYSSKVIKGVKKYGKTKKR